MRRAALLASALAVTACQRAPAPEAPPPRFSPADPAPKRPTIVSLNPCSDAVLAEVADPAQILGLSHYSMDVRSSSMDVAVARRFRAVGGSGEEVLALRADVVVAGAYLPASTAAVIERAGLRLVRLPIARTVEESRAQVRQLAALAGNREGGERLVARIGQALERAAPPPGFRPVSALVWQSGGIVAGDDTLVADVMRRAGLVNATAARGLRQADYLPLETMLADPPQLILAAGNVAGNEDRLLSHPALAHLPGARRARIDPSFLWCGGPTIPRLAARLAQVRKAM